MQQKTKIRVGRFWSHSVLHKPGSSTLVDIDPAIYTPQTQRPSLSVLVSIWAPVHLYFKLAQTEIRISYPYRSCVMNPCVNPSGKPLQLRSMKIHLLRKTITSKQIHGNFNDVIALHLALHSNKFPARIFLMYVMLFCLFPRIEDRNLRQE